MVGRPIINKRVTKARIMELFPDASSFVRIIGHGLNLSVVARPLTWFSVEKDKDRIKILKILISVLACIE